MSAPKELRDEGQGSTYRTIRIRLVLQGDIDEVEPRD